MELAAAVVWFVCFVLIGEGTRRDVLKPSKTAQIEFKQEACIEALQRPCIGKDDCGECKYK